MRGAGIYGPGGMNGDGTAAKRRRTVSSVRSGVERGLRRSCFVARRRTMDGRMVLPVLTGGCRSRRGGVS